MKIIKNTYEYLDAYQDRGAVENKEHIGYIVDRTGFEEFLKFIMKDVHMNPKAEINGRPYWVASITTPPMSFALPCIVSPTALMMDILPSPEKMHKEE